jgi:nitrogen fixation/metabolism regulation signal transduction histidine kinase
MNRIIPQEDAFFEAVIDAVPSPLFVVDEEVRVYAYNRAAVPLFAEDPGKILRMGCGDALYCIHSAETPQGCGGGEACKKCVIRLSVGKSCGGQSVVREKTEMQLIRENRAEKVQMFITTAPLHYKDQSYVLVVLEDISELFELRSILPICASCKKIRNDQEYWQNVEDYLAKHSDIKFTHSLCPKCAEELYPGLGKK